MEGEVQFQLIAKIRYQIGLSFHEEVVDREIVAVNAEAAVGLARLEVLRLYHEFGYLNRFELEAELKPISNSIWEMRWVQGQPAKLDAEGLPTHFEEEWLS